MPTWKPVENRLGIKAMTNIDSSDEYGIGTIIRAKDATNGDGEFMYCTGVASCLAGSFVHINADDFSITLAVADGIGPMGVALGALVADKYGWVQIGGKASGRALASFADNGNVYLTATAGYVDDAVVDGDYVRNAKGASAVVSATSLADFELARPFSTDDLETGS
jgi:hypothetical protein